MNQAEDKVTPLITKALIAVSEARRDIEARAKKPGFKGLRKDSEVDPLLELIRQVTRTRDLYIYFAIKTDYVPRKLLAKNLNLTEARISQIYQTMKEERNET